MRVLQPGLVWWPSWADVYPNHLLVPKIQCPVLVMHVSGTVDPVHVLLVHVSGTVDPVPCAGHACESGA